MEAPLEELEGETQTDDDDREGGEEEREGGMMKEARVRRKARGWTDDD